ncbi:VOC family protein [Schinkia azotoformans]|uniref:VOC family protein n=1 Tax=Schinkia azotoformans TaxID=1454 RepID=UPI00398AD1BC
MCEVNVKFDHLVHFTSNPKETQAAFQKLGFNTIKGGNHTNWGTRNCLCYFHNLGYIEWIGFTDFEIAKTSDNILIQQIVNDSAFGEGFSTMAFRTNDISALQKELRQKDYETIGPFDGNRIREDGSILSWSMLFLKEKSDDQVRYPFFIQWGHADDIRKTEMKALWQHKNGEPSISYISFAVQNVQKTILQYCRLFDIDQNASRNGHDEFGDFTEIPISNISIRLYRKALESSALIGSNRPLCCGIAGVTDEKESTINVQGAIYKIQKRHP